MKDNSVYKISVCGNVAVSSSLSSCRYFLHIYARALDISKLCMMDKAPKAILEPI